MKKYLPLSALALVTSFTSAFALYPVCPLAEPTEPTESAMTMTTTLTCEDPPDDPPPPAPPPPWTPSYYRCAQDQLNNDQGRGRQGWAMRWANIDPYNISATRDQRFWLSSDTPNAQTAYEVYGLWLYPVYVDPSTGAPFLGPGAPGSATAGYTGDQISSLDYTYKPVHIVVDIVCEPGCYTPDQQVLFESGPVSIEEAQQAGANDVVTLSADSTLDALQLVRNKVERYTLDRDPSKQDILIFRMQSGGKLSVTLEHPLVTRNGAVMKARDFVAGEYLVKQDGTFDQIVSIEKTQWFGKVYNLRPVSKELTSNILVAQGYLNGSGRFQSEYVTELNRIILRNNVPDEFVLE